jgi:hypothetical protein
VVESKSFPDKKILDNLSGFFVESLVSNEDISALRAYMGNSRLSRFYNSEVDIRKKSDCLNCIVLMLFLGGLSHAAVVSWDGSSADITGLTENQRSPDVWTIADEAWNTTDEIVPAVGSQASFKVALSNVSDIRQRALIRQDWDRIVVSGGGLSAAPSPYVTLMGFDTTSFDDQLVLFQISVTLREETAADTTDLRWFVQAEGQTYVSAVFAADISIEEATYMLDHTTPIEWFAFDGDANLTSAVGASQGTLALQHMAFTDVDYVGFYTEHTYTTMTNWHGTRVQNFWVKAIPTTPVPVFDTYILIGRTGMVNSNYIDTLADDASHPDNDPLSFIKTSGPDWFSVASDGNLSGTPRSGNIGENDFTVEVSDSTGNTDQAILKITVNSTPEHIADLNGDRWVDLYDFSRLASWWANDQCLTLAGCMGADTNNDGLVGTDDLQAVVQQWLCQAGGPGRAMSYSGTWGPRMLLPAMHQPADLADFNVSYFMGQIRQLTTASYVMVNIHRGAGGTHYCSPHPELAAIVDPNLFPTRDLLGEVLDGLEVEGKKGLVYFHAEGIGEDRASAEAWDNWNSYIQSLGMTHFEAVAELIVKYYSEKFGSKIAGWWFDGAGKLSDAEKQLYEDAARAGNPDTILAFNSHAGYPLECTSHCDYFGGHPTPVKTTTPWSLVNEPMIDQIETGPWLDTAGVAVADLHDGALGHVFMPLQERWNSGPAEFPTAQAIDWMTRVIFAGGMYTWSVPRSESGFALDQFNQFLEMDTAIKNLIE